MSMVVSRGVSEDRPRRLRSDGAESYRRILEAAGEVAGMRGYDGTSIAAVSAASGLPASSIYHFFANKDELLAAVITSSFGELLSTVDLTEEAFAAGGVGLEELLDAVAATFLGNPRFLRLGLMLSLEQRPSEASARRAFLSARGEAVGYLLRVIAARWPQLKPADADLLATYVMAGADGLFIAREIDETVDLRRLFALHIRAAVHLADGLLGDRGR